MKKQHYILLAVNLAMIVGFGTLFFQKANYEFIIYVGVILAAIGAIGASLRRVNYPMAALVGLTVWAGLHMAGGGISVGEGRLYDVILLPLSDTWPILRYDQVVHAWGFGAATLVMFSILRSMVPEPSWHPIAMPIILFMAGLGVGAMNETLEFLVSTVVPSSGVGGYVNTSLDLCSNTIGVLGAIIYTRVRYKNLECCYEKAAC
jgi:hypothetical protein